MIDDDECHEKLTVITESTHFGDQDEETVHPCDISVQSNYESVCLEDEDEQEDLKTK